MVVQLQIIRKCVDHHLRGKHFDIWKHVKLATGLSRLYVDTFMASAGFFGYSMVFVDGLLRRYFFGSVDPPTPGSTPRPSAEGAAETNHSQSLLGGYGWLKDL